MCCWATSSRALALAAALFAVAAQAATVERRLGVMGTALSVEVEGADRARALEASEAAVRAIEATERRLSTWRADSELSELNRAPIGVRSPLSAVTAAELEEALRCAKDTGGAFDPAVGALVEAWDLRGNGRVPNRAERAAALRRSGHARLAVEGHSAVRRSEVRVEEGGFGKGAALDRAGEALRAAGAGSAVLDLGGQVLVHRSEATIPLAHPERREEPALLLRVSSGSVSTSGNSERARVVDGTRVGHLLDPRTGLPAEEFGTLVVWAPTGLRADCLSTALYVLGAEAALAWAREHGEVQVAVLQPGPGGGVRVRASAGLLGRLSAAGEHIELEFDVDEERADEP